MAHSESKPTHRETEREKKDPTRCIHQPHSVSHSPLMPHRETEQNQKRKRQAFSRTPRHKRSSESKQELFYRICWNLRYWLAVLYCANREQHEPKCATWAVVTFLMQAEEDRLRQMCSVFHFLSFFFYTISTQNKSRRCSTLLSLSLFKMDLVFFCTHFCVEKLHSP